ncbi:cysteine dioxygenase [Natronoglycomyces albus]|uniref:Cysteine dioxygenase family protein n=1 Tax=Natronoglycomyces albus TaxID=2811108 RepID=A0A895XP79_9ACTN|nr:cysteine dioxygenase family protein [Natronoglycomyces albus]QSB05562.1 cysteine dioxygenase family protein [Natronoglycomyces albus]
MPTQRSNIGQQPENLTERLVALAHSYACETKIEARFRPHSRWAAKISSAPDHEAWLLAWLPGQGTDLHDHGGTGQPSNAAVKVISGELSEYTVQAGEFPRLHRRDLQAGDVSAVSNRTIHAMRNRSSLPAVSIHVYVPKLECMRTYLVDETGLTPSQIKLAGDDWAEASPFHSVDYVCKG